MGWIIYFALMLIVMSLPLLALLLGLISPFIARFFNWIFWLNCSRYWLWRDEFGELNEIK